jgi:phosphoenolpyruvate carboxylase
MRLMRKMTREYQSQLSRMADLINGISVFIPGRRARKLHVGLFGYSRSLKGIRLPRAIKFCAAFYSIGIPPELLGLSALSEKEFEELHEHYTKIDEDLKDAARFLNPANLSMMPRQVKQGMAKVLEWVGYEEDTEYCEMTSAILHNYKSGKHTPIAEAVKAAAWRRGFLG